MLLLNTEQQTMLERAKALLDNALKGNTSLSKASAKKFYEDVCGLFGLDMNFERGMETEYPDRTLYTMEDLNGLVIRKFGRALAFEKKIWSLSQARRAKYANEHSTCGLGLLAQEIWRRVNAAVQNFAILDSPYSQLQRLINDCMTLHYLINEPDTVKDEVYMQALFNLAIKTEQLQLWWMAQARVFLDQKTDINVNGLYSPQNFKNNLAVIDGIVDDSTSGLQGMPQFAKNARFAYLHIWAIVLESRMNTRSIESNRIDEYYAGCQKGLYKIRKYINAFESFKQDLTRAQQSELDIHNVRRAYYSSFRTNYDSLKALYAEFVAVSNCQIIFVGESLKEILRVKEKIAQELIEKLGLNGGVDLLGNPRIVNPGLNNFIELRDQNGNQTIMSMEIYLAFENNLKAEGQVYNYLIGQSNERIKAMINDRLDTLESPQSATTKLKK